MVGGWNGEGGRKIYVWGIFRSRVSGYIYIACLIFLFVLSKIAVSE